ncbi:unnamed protein product [Lactuca saligna]|uniref:KIB1-4 beta-propeller domain-containing protein n=1 Tax=Lactuca saligna TaxID=75948 RepID=A0AA36E0K1_LACSI|nr:unnamed protein product [Lactuca saligna]
MSSWSDLLPEILNKIAGKFEFYEDLISFLCVCSSWRSSASTTKKLIPHLPSRFPLLMLAESNTQEDDHQDCYKFFLLSSGTMRKMQLPEARWQRCISTHGWLLTTGEEEFSAKLLHPLSRTQIDLPELYMFEELYFDQDEWIYYGQSMRKVVFTSSNPLLLDPDFRVIIIWGQTIGFCRLGDVSWTRIAGCDGHLLDITYHNLRKRQYTVTTVGSIYECDILSGGPGRLTLKQLSTLPQPEFDFSYHQSAYLLEWGYDRLLMVTREHQWYKKHVWMMKSGRNSSVLGDKAVFLGFNSSFAIDAAGGIKPDCIYFTDDLYEPYRDLADGGGGDVGVYHMSDGSIGAIMDAQQHLFRGRPPLWLQTSTIPCD